MILISIMPALASSPSWPRCAAAEGREEPASLVNIFIGTTESRGKCYPAATAPFGMTEWAPITIDPEDEYAKRYGGPPPPYDYRHQRLYGFIATHYPSGSCMCDYGWFVLMPASGELDPRPWAPYTHYGEEGAPGYYSIKIYKYGVKVEITATERCGFFRFTYFTARRPKYLVIYVPEGSLQIDPKGRKVLVSSTIRFPAYYVLCFDTPFAKWGIVQDGEIRFGVTSGYGPNARAVIVFPDETHTVLVKIGSSFISLKQAELNLRREIPGWDFDEVRRRVYERWNELLSRVEVEGDREYKVIFYTALYHCLLLPRIFYEIGEDGKPYHMSPFDGLVHEGIYFEDYSLWDTFRATHPLFVLLYPRIARDLVIGLLNMYEESGWMPKWPNPGFSNVMIGTHADSVLADAWVKGIRDFSLTEAYMAARKDAMVPAKPRITLMNLGGAIVPLRLRAGLGRGTACFYLSAAERAGAGAFQWRYDDERWHHYVLVYNGGRVAVYIDGKLVANARAKGALAFTEEFIVLGSASRTDIIKEAYTGDLDEILVHADALKPEEIEALRKGSIIKRDKLVLALTFDEPMVVKDEVSGIEGEIHGKVTWVDGVKGHALRFEGLDAVVLPLPSKFRRKLKDKVTVSFWFRTLQSPTTYEGRQATEYYKRYGYVPLDLRIGEEVSITLEAAYDDFCVAQLALALYNQTKDPRYLKDYEYFIRRSKYYKNVYYPGPGPYAGLVRGRYMDGSWATPYDPAEFTSYTTEATPWIYTWFVPHDVQGLINIMGGPEKFVERLEYFMEMGEKESPDFVWSRFYTHGNEPSHHVAYLFVYAGAPWRTQYWVREIMERCYKLDPRNGLAGDDDCGQMSAWFVFSAMGFYPVCPGAPYYVIGSPLFEKVVIHLDEYWGGGTFTIIAHGNSPQNRYIQRALLNGKPYNKAWIRHKDIVRGGVLELFMSDKPSTWGAECPPPSLTKSPPRVEVVNIGLPEEVHVGLPFSGTITVENKGGLGRAAIPVMLDGRTCTVLIFILDEGERRDFTVQLRVLGAGTHTLRVGNTTRSFEASLLAGFHPVILELNATYGANETRVSVLLVNAGDKPGTVTVPIIIDGEVRERVNVTLAAGQALTIERRYPLLYGIHEIIVPEKRVVYFGPIRDYSGHARGIKVHGEVRPVIGPFGYAIRLAPPGYVEIPSYKEICVSSEFTIAFWVRPLGARGMERLISKWGAAIETKSYQIWLDSGRLAVETTKKLVLTDIQLSPKVWYHIVWVHSASLGKELVYVNGKLAWSHPYIGNARVSDHPLGIGRSIGENVYFYGDIDEVMIFNRALTEQEILEIYQHNKPPAEGLVLWLGFDGEPATQPAVVHEPPKLMKPSRPQRPTPQPARRAYPTWILAAVLAIAMVLVVLVAYKLRIRRA